MMDNKICPFNSNYLIYKDGRIYSLYKKRFIEGWTNSDGYVNVLFYDNKKHSSLLVHRIVAKTFLGDSDKEVNHKDGNKLNNSVENLEWSSHEENMKHAKINNLLNPRKGVKHGMCKFDNDFIEKIRECRKNGMTYIEIEKLYGISSTYAGKVCSYKNRKDEEVS